MKRVAHIFVIVFGFVYECVIFLLLFTVLAKESMEKVTDNALSRVWRITLS
jgi:hypothetical protein